MGLSATFRWDTEQEKGFDELRHKWMEAPVLAYTNSADLFILDTDTSNHAIGAELLQVQNVVERLIGFGSFVLERIHIDIIGPLIETPRGNKYVLVVVD